MMPKAGNKIFPYMMVFFIVATSIWATLWQTPYVYAPLEWGLMLSNAKDLAKGLAPYEQIFIQYGYLTTFIHATAYVLLGSNLTSLMIITSVGYGIGLFFVFRISLLAKLTYWESFAVLLIYFLLHPIVIYPWSNYIAFPFLLLGLKYNIEKNNNLMTAAVSGLFFGLAILSREGLAPAIIVFILASAIFEYLTAAHSRQSIKSLGITVIGAIIPIVIFILYLINQNLLVNWLKMSWDVPKIYADVMFPHMRGFSLIRPWTILPMLHPLFDQIKHGFIDFEPRWILFGLIVGINTFVVLKGFISRSYLRTHLIEIKIACLSILLISSTLHLPEVFRVATGSAIGLINIWTIAKNQKLKLWLSLSFIFTLGLTAMPNGTGYKYSTTNYFFPTRPFGAATTLITQPTEFAGQRWSIHISEFYAQLEKDLNLIKNKCPMIRYSHNESHDAFIAVISPFLRYQLAPFWIFPEMLNLRSELTIEKKVSADRDIVLLQSSYIAGKSIALSIPLGFYLYRTYKAPDMPRLDAEIRLLLPLNCEPLK